jgi:glycosyltransferase involved in cell wall biosynthesis
MESVAAASPPSSHQIRHLIVSDTTPEHRAPDVRVCVIAPSLGILGGQAVQALRLVEHLNQGQAVSVDLLPVNPKLPGLLGRLQSIKYVRTVLTSVRYLASLLGQLRHYDVIHVFSASYLSFMLAPLPALLVGRLYGKKVVLNYHSGEAQDHLERWPSAIRLMGLAHEIIVPSAYLVDVFAGFGIRTRAIFNFIDVDDIPYRRRTTLRPRFLTNRNLESLYNVGCSLRAFARVQREYPDAELTVAGFGSQRAMLESIARELGLRNTTFVGRVPANEMAAQYDKSDIFLNASNIDNMPLSILDSFAAGVPVVTTNAGGIPYVVRDGETGFLVERGDSDGLADAALRLLRDDDLATRIGDAARQECLARYTWPVVREEWENLYLSLARMPAPVTAVHAR